MVGFCVLCDYICGLVLYVIECRESICIYTIDNFNYDTSVKELNLVSYNMVFVHKRDVRSCIVGYFSI